MTLISEHHLLCKFSVSVCGTLWGIPLSSKSVQPSIHQLRRTLSLSIISCGDLEH